MVFNVEYNVKETVAWSKKRKKAFVVSADFKNPEQFRWGLFLTVYVVEMTLRFPALFG